MQTESDKHFINII